MDGSPVGSDPKSVAEAAQTLCRLMIKYPERRPLPIVARYPIDFPLILTSEYILRQPAELGLRLLSR
jgi:hypothetical protein